MSIILLTSIAYCILTYFLKRTDTCTKCYSCNICSCCSYWFRPCEAADQFAKWFRYVKSHSSSSTFQQSAVYAISVYRSVVESHWRHTHANRPEPVCSSSSRRDTWCCRCRQGCGAPRCTCTSRWIRTWNCRPKQWRFLPAQGRHTWRLQRKVQSLHIGTQCLKIKLN